MVYQKSYPAHCQLQLQLRQPSSDTHSLPNTKGNISEGVDGAVLPQPALWFELLSIVKVLLVGAQSMAVNH